MSSLHVPPIKREAREPEGALRPGQGTLPTRDFWSPNWGSTELLLPRRESRRLLAVSRFGELLGVGLGVAAVRMMTGGGRLPRPSRCPLGVTAREYIFISGGGGGHSRLQGSQARESTPPRTRPREPQLCEVGRGSTPSPALPQRPPTHLWPGGLGTYRNLPPSGWTSCLRLCQICWRHPVPRRAEAHEPPLSGEPSVPSTPLWSSRLGGRTDMEEGGLEGRADKVSERQRPLRVSLSRNPTQRAGLPPPGSSPHLRLEALHQDGH